MILFEIYINPLLTNLDNIRKNLYSFLKFKNFLDKFNIVIYSKYKSLDFNLKKFSKLKIHFVRIDEKTTNLWNLWSKNIEIYNNVNWVIHYDIEYELIEFDFIKMIFKKLKNTFVKKNHKVIYTNLFCIDTDLLIHFVTSSYNKELTPDFILNNSLNYYFLKYMNIVSKNERNENIYI